MKFDIWDSPRDGITILSADEIIITSCELGHKFPRDADFPVVINTVSSKVVVIYCNCHQ